MLIASAASQGTVSAVAEICQFKAVSAYSGSHMLLLVVLLVSLPPLFGGLKFRGLYSRG